MNTQTIFGGIKVVPDPTLAPDEWKLLPLKERQKIAMDLGRRYDEALNLALGFQKDKKEDR